MNKGNEMHQEPFQNYYSNQLCQTIGASLLPLTATSHRQYPLELRALEEIFHREPDNIIKELLHEHSGYTILIKNDINDDEMFLLFKVLAKSCKFKFNKENLIDLLALTFCESFVMTLKIFILSISRFNEKKIIEFFQHLFEVCFLFHDNRPVQSICSVEVIITSVHQVLQKEDMHILANELEMCDKLKMRLDSFKNGCFDLEVALKKETFFENGLYIDSDDLETSFNYKMQSVHKIKAKITYPKQPIFPAEAKMQPQDYCVKQSVLPINAVMEPPDDFRKKSILPTEAEICGNYEPFLRKNIIDGRYNNSNQYLDIHFRLLREDFIRPLREGLIQFRDNLQYKKQNRDLKIYKRIIADKSKPMQGEIIYYVQINKSHNFRPENSKNLLFGNLLCFSNDNFKTLIFGYVYDRSISNLRKGLIGVKLDGICNDFKGYYDMAESKAYFVAYKHVLEALQNIESLTLPHYLLDISNELHYPSYLSLKTNFDLRVVKNFKLMKRRNPRSRCLPLILPIDTQEPHGDFYPELSKITVAKPVHLWPSAQLLSLDQSQREALHGALSRQLAIIQGPPGTGKTFLGLKVTQILLHNSDKWNGGKQNPILVVCYTNHALDQFLEGMVSFTSSIVRVGSRSESEIISKFQIGSLARSARKKKLISRSICSRSFQLRNEVKLLEKEFATVQEELQELKNAAGIFSYAALCCVIPNEFDIVLKHVGIENWLLGMGLDGFYRFDYIFQYCNTSVQSIACTNNGSNFDICVENLSINDNEGIWKDANVFAVQEDINRVLDIGSSTSYDKYTVNLEYMYDSTFKNICIEISFLAECLQDELYKDDMELFYRHDYLTKKLQMMDLCLNYLKKPKVFPLNHPYNVGEHTSNIFLLSIPERWQYYFLWIDQQITELSKELPIIRATFQQKSKALMELKDQEYLYVMRNSDVVGMTTTGAAKFNKINQALSPKIVIIEEAAEILESHVVTSLTTECQHLIMIGDHQQLRPSTTVYDLAIKYNLETSLFERMINNGIRYNTLQYQHRMRPSISKLMHNIYPLLKDDNTVEDQEHIRGMTNDIYFINHEFYENKTYNDSGSHENSHEAFVIMALCWYLLQQGYTSDKITILTPYSGQFFLLRKIQRNYPDCLNVKICVVDSFQGEENDIILLSLVRGNPDGNVGFLKVENRVCVALSRAKFGFYIIGNMQQLCTKSELWKKMKKSLEDQNCIGHKLPIKCENHPSVCPELYDAEQLLLFSPYGGCTGKCSFKFESCGHSCPNTCHALDTNQDHKNCMQICLKKICSFDNHLCLKKCWQKCGPCTKLVRKVLPCRHSSEIACYIDPCNVKCLIVVEKALPHCQHFNRMACSENIDSWVCTHPCDIELDCGHECKLQCHVMMDPNHEKSLCNEECNLLNKDCNFNHKCNKRCHEKCGQCTYLVKKQAPCGHDHIVRCFEKIEDLICQELCNKLMPCGHHCARKCHDTCGGCEEIVEKLIHECGHLVKMPCGLEPSKSYCSGNCPLQLNCEHFCTNKCNEPCTIQCQEIVPLPRKCPINHQIDVPCHLYNSVGKEESWLLCDEECKEILSCGHLCNGKCGSCFNGRVHIPCKEPCEKILVCGHVCKSYCSLNCPPCQSICEVKCEHRSCKNKCSIPCKPCQEPCLWKCHHKTCMERCGKFCSRGPCDEPCAKILPCGHFCIGFCGDPCIPFCKVCNEEHLAKIIFPSTECEETNSRYVLLEDCNHVIEVNALEHWLQKEDNLIGMKQCPLCKQSIFNCRRYNHIIKQAYEDVEKINYKYFNHIKGSDLQKEIREILLSKSESKSTRKFYREERTALLKSIGIHSTVFEKKKHYSTNEYEKVLFKAKVLSKGAVILLNLQQHYYNEIGVENVTKYLQVLIQKVLEIEDRASYQFADEVASELQRIDNWPAILKVKNVASKNSKLTLICSDIDRLSAPVIKFDKNVEQAVRKQLKKAEMLVRELRVLDSKRLEIRQSMTLSYKSWSKCPNSHVYCLTGFEVTNDSLKCSECEAVNDESKCKWKK